VSASDPREVLRQAGQLVKLQQYAGALEKYLWFHDHALDADRSLAGVRLSYALAEWVDLGEVYPPARRALESVRDAKAESLKQGTYDASLFHDVASINRALGQVERTRHLFKTIADADRGVAEKCFHIALESLVHTKEFGLARTFMTDPRKEIERFAVPFKFARSARDSDWEMFQEALVGIYVKKVSLILQVFLGVGEEDMANHLRHYALECLPDTQLRDRITARLYSSPPSTGIQ
jgi:hypothetical protein